MLAGIIVLRKCDVLGDVLWILIAICGVEVGHCIVAL